ncbi:MAG: hypothetical protein LBQ86_01575, partial [Holophagales bacterium]|nr:hypothetical protein [Holophagales bacterium]
MTSHKLLWDEIQNRAIKFSNAWQNASSEKSQKHDFIRALLNVFGITENVGEFEKTIKAGQGRSNF